MVTLGELASKTEALAAIGGADVLVAARAGAEEVLGWPPDPRREDTLVFRHETIGMMKIDRVEQIDQLLRVVSGASVVVPIRKKEASVWSDITLGRAASSDIEIADPAISNLHAQFYISPDEGTVLVQDLGSSNGTFLNRQPLHPHRSAVLAAGDCLRFGQSVFYYLPGVVLAEVLPRIV